jgi:hypothetical protein
VNVWRALHRRGAVRDADARLSRRVGDVMRLVERFVYDLGLLIGGHPGDLDAYVVPGVRARLRSALTPTVTGGATRPDFGEYAQLRIEGDLLDLSESVRAVVEFDDRSTRADGHVGVVTRSRRRVRLELLLDPAVARVLDYRIEIV